MKKRGLLAHQLRLWFYYSMPQNSILFLLHKYMITMISGALDHKYPAQFCINLSSESHPVIELLVIPRWWHTGNDTGIPLYNTTNTHLLCYVTQIIHIKWNHFSSCSCEIFMENLPWFCFRLKQNIFVFFLTQKRLICFIKRLLFVYL